LQQVVQLLKTDEAQSKQVIGQLTAPFQAALRRSFQVGRIDYSVGYEEFFKSHVIDPFLI